MSLLDVLLGPLWVRLVVSENPGVGALTGGAVVLVAVVWYLSPSLSWWPIGKGRRTMQAGYAEATPTPRRLCGECGSSAS